MKSRKATRRDARRLFRLCLVNGVLDQDRVRKVVTRLTQSTQRDRFALLSQFRRLVRLECKNRTAQVESATPLPAAFAGSLQTSLDQAYGPGLTVSFTQTPALIGGMRIRVGSDVYDGSVRARLAALEARF
jgi:F-type H+-transporting ATPase subunit delta